MLKRMLGLLLALLLVTGCQAEEPAANTTMIANPFTTCDTLEDAEKLLGYSLELPSGLTVCSNIIYRAANSEALTLLEVIFDYGGNEIRIRKSPGQEDNSGVYEDFQIAIENEEGLVMRGDDNTNFRLAVWQDGEYSYSISCEQGVTEETLYDWVYSTK